MDSPGRKERVVSRVGKGRLEVVSDKRVLHLGIDVGSTSSDVVVLSSEGEVLFSEYCRAGGRPIETVLGQLRRIGDEFNASQIRLCSVTGAAGRFAAELLGVPFINEVMAQGRAIEWLYPKFEQATIIEMGGQDSKLIFLSRGDNGFRIRDFALNTVCAAGTGSFLDQQADRLGVSIEEEFAELAMQSENVPRMAGRCSVFAKSDMIHLQQQATPVEDIIAGLCLALARNLKSNLGCGRRFVRPVVFTGGVAANAGVVRSIEQVLDMEAGELVVPDEHFFTGAIGAVMVARDKEISGSWPEVEKLDEYLRHRGGSLARAPRRKALSRPSRPIPVSRVYDELLDEAESPIDAYLGVDVGSISTNVALIDGQRRVLAKAYLMTAGRPLEAVRKGLEMVREKAEGKVKILGAATTGSGRYLTGDFIGADTVINEITAQAAGAAIVNPQVDTIFEIGGQDSKYISLENGVVVDFEMNHACAAGTGSFLEEQSQRLGINIDEEFGELAFTSERPIKLGERCTVFMETDLLSYQQQGARTNELVAGLSYSIVSNYLNRVVGRRRIGDNICFQGGTAFNKAVWAAFEKVTGKSITVPDHHEVTGAIGAASIAAERMHDKAADNSASDSGGLAESSFRGFENLIDVDYSVETFVCEHCPNHCEIKKVELPGSQPLYYGSRCDRYNVKKKSGKAGWQDAFRYRNDKMFEYSGLKVKDDDREQKSKGTIGIPMAVISWQLLPLFGRFFQELGYEVVVSGRTDKKIIKLGTEFLTSQPCFPIKVAYGHIAELINKKVDYIFLPSIVSMTSSYPDNEHNQLCPYVQSLAYQARTAFSDNLADSEILTVPLRLGEGERLIRRTFKSLGKKLGCSGGAVNRALKAGFGAQSAFDKCLKAKGREILDELGDDEKLFVLVSRPYNGCDDGVNMRLPEKLAELGARLIPMEMLELEKAALSDKCLHKSIYWSYGQKILRAAEVIRSDKRLYGVYLSNFSCGPDSFLMTFFKELMSLKPCLQLEIDEHSADAGIITRLEAFFESLKNYSPEEHSEQLGLDGGRKAVSKGTQVCRMDGRRKLWIPYMGDNSYGLAACFRSYDQPAEVMPIANEESLVSGRAYSTGKECLPFAITTGEMLGVIGREDFDAERAAFFMPGSSGPCRFGMYNCLHKVVFKYAGVEDVPVVSPNQDDRFYRDMLASMDGRNVRSLMKDMWTSVIGIDLLVKLILRCRPFAVDKEKIQNLYDESLRKWVKLVETGGSLSEKVELMESIGKEFAKVEIDDRVRKPHIGIVGEIYVRSHPFANSDIIRRLEGLGACCSLASLAEWVYYTNFTRKCQAWRRGSWSDYVTNSVQAYYQHKIEVMLAGPLEKRFGRLAEERVEEVLDLAEPYIDKSFEGEAILSIGKMLEYYKEGVGGVVNVMPFSCMPSTVVSSQTRRVSGECDDMPILNLSFDGQEDATLTTRLEAFVEQASCRKGVMHRPVKVGGTTG